MILMKYCISLLKKLNLNIPKIVSWTTKNYNHISSAKAWY